MRVNWVQEAIARRMKEAAREAGLTTTELAKRLGVSAATVYRWWEGERSPSEQMVERYAAAVGKELGWMYSAIDRGEVMREFADWALKFSRLVAEGMAADEAFDVVTGTPEELSLRERRELRSNTGSLRSFMASLPADEAARRALLEQFALLLKDGK